MKILDLLKHSDIRILYRASLKEIDFEGFKIMNDLSNFLKTSDISWPTG